MLLLLLCLRHLRGTLRCHIHTHSVTVVRPKQNQLYYIFYFTIFFTLFVFFFFRLHTAHIQWNDMRPLLTHTAIIVLCTPAMAMVDSDVMSESPTDSLYLSALQGHLWLYANQ